MAPANRCVFFSCKAGLMLTLLQPSFVVIVQLLSHVCLCDSTDCSTPGFPVLRYLPEFAQSHVHWVDDAIQPSHPLLPPSSPALSFPAPGSFPVSRLRIRWPSYWSFSISPSNEYSRLISFRMDWLDLLAVQGTVKNLLQHHSSKASILQHSACFLWSNERSSDQLPLRLSRPS